MVPRLRVRSRNFWFAPMLICAVGPLMSADSAVAQRSAAVRAIHSDCQDGKLDRDHSLANLKKARRSLPDDVASYTDCSRVIDREIRRLKDRNVLFTLKGRTVVSPSLDGTRKRTKAIVIPAKAGEPVVLQSRAFWRNESIGERTVRLKPGFRAVRLPVRTGVISTPGRFPMVRLVLRATDGVGNPFRIKVRLRLRV